MHGDPSSDHPDPGITNSESLVQANDSASMRLNVHVMTKAVAAAHTS